MTIGTLAARIMADASGIKSGMGLARDELKITRQAFLDSAADADKLNTALAQLESARGKGAFANEEQYARAVAAVRSELDPMTIAQQKATAEQEKATAAALQSRGVLREQIATYKMSADQIALWKMQQQGVDSVLISNVAKLQQHRAAQIADTEATARAKQITDSVRTPLELQSLAIRELNQLLAAGKITQETHTRAIQQANQTMNAGAAAATRYGVVASNAIRSVAGAFGVTLGFTGIVYGFRSAIQGAERFEQAMASSTAIVLNLTQEQRTAFEETAKQVAYQTKFSAEEAAKAYYFLASAGLDASQQIKAMPVVAKFAQAGMFDLAQATDLLTDAQMALGMSYKDPIQNQAEMIRLGDVLVKANVLANASVEQFSTSLTSGAGAALKMVNKSAEEGVAILAAFASQGKKGEEAGTALNIVFRDMQTKAIENARVWKENNVVVFDAAGKMRNFADILKDLETRLAGASDEQKKMTLAQLGFADKSVMYTQMLLGQSDAIKEYEDKLRDAGGTMQDVADRQMPPLTKMTNQLKAEWEAFTVAFAKPIVSGLASQTAEVGALTTALATVLSIQDRLAALKDMAKYVPTKLLLEGEIRDIKLQLLLNPSPENKQILKTELAGYRAQLEEAAKRWDDAWNRYTSETDAGDKYIEQLKKMRQELDITADKAVTAGETKADTEAVALSAAKIANAGNAKSFEESERLAREASRRATEEMKLDQAELRDEFAATAAAGESVYDPFTKAQKESMKEAEDFAKQREQANKTIEDALKKAKEEADTYGMTAKEQRAYADAAELARLQEMGASEEQIAHLKELQAELAEAKRRKEELRDTDLTIEAGSMASAFDAIRRAQQATGKERIAEEPKTAAEMLKGFADARRDWRLAGFGMLAGEKGSLAGLSQGEILMRGFEDSKADWDKSFSKPEDKQIPWLEKIANVLQQIAAKEGITIEEVSL